MYECSLHVARCGTSQIQIVKFYETDLHKTFREIELFRSGNDVIPYSTR